jgi:hypothetical protein
MRPETDRTLHLHLALFAAVNLVFITAWALTGAGGGSWPFWLLIVWGSVLAWVVARATDEPSR